MGEVITSDNPEFDTPSTLKKRLLSLKEKIAVSSLFETYKKVRTAREVSKRNFSEQDNFAPFLHEEDGEVYISPFTVFVYGTDGTVLGEGTVIGKLYDKDLNAQEPVVSISDERSPTGEVQLLNQECTWKPIGEEELEATMREFGELVRPASDYVMGETKLPYA